MKKVELLRALEYAAGRYCKVASKRIKKNQINRSSLVKQHEIEAVSAEFVNFFAEELGISYGLHRTHLRQARKGKK